MSKSKQLPIEWRVTGAIKHIILSSLFYNAYSKSWIYEGDAFNAPDGHA